jgi:23S rRNA pseudouridine1911/1915/1917 synthase
MMKKEAARLTIRPGGGIPVSYIIRPDDAGLRIDHFLVLQLPALSRSRLTNAIVEGAVQLNGKKTKASRKLQVGDAINGCINESSEELSVIPQKIAFDILFEDEHLLIISKPPGLVVHPANGNPDNTLVNGLLYHCRTIGEVGDPVRPGIVHRLDKDTSGVMVAAKNNEVHRKLVDIFKSRQVQKKYLALVLGVPKTQSGRLVAAIGRHPVNRKKMAILENSGKFAATNWKLKKVYGGKYSLMELVIETGRTHQIRVHMASIGHPVAGDISYGPGRADPLFPRQMLHSAELRFSHPVTGCGITGIAPLWPDMKNVLQKLEDGEIG